MSNLTAFVQHKKLTLTHDGKHIAVPATGSVFLCKEASSPFEMQFDDQAWFPFDQGLGFNLGPDRQFTKLNFRALNLDTDTNLEFYVANAAVGDSRLTITRDENRFQIISFMAAKTLVKGFAAASINAGACVRFYGTGGTGLAGAAYSYRKSIVITNNDPAGDLEIYSGVSAATVRLATVFHLQAWYLETNADIWIKNETAAPIACRVCEVFYPV